MSTHHSPVTVVAILRAEKSFVREWIAYHRLIGIGHFVLYDDESTLPLKRLIDNKMDGITIVPWWGRSPPGVNKQLAAYRDAVASHVVSDWVTFIDGDEFIVLRRHENISALLADLSPADAVLLTWHAFGHCGFYNDPPGLITSSLIRRRARPGRQAKTIVRRDAIVAIDSPHECVLGPGRRAVDANGRPYTPELYAGKTDVAHINHYMCRSFQTWMNRVERGDTVYADPATCPKENAWRLDREKCLKKFVKICVDTNEVVDDYMRKYEHGINELLRQSGL